MGLLKIIMLVHDEMSQMQNRVRHCKAANRYNSRLLIREQLNNSYLMFLVPFSIFGRYLMRFFLFAFQEYLLAS